MIKPMTPTAYRLLDRPVHWLACGMAFVLIAVGVPPWSKMIDRLADIARTCTARAGRNR